MQELRRLAAFAVFAVTYVIAAHVHGATFSFEYADDDGPVITGFIESASDELTVSSWRENGGGVEWWTPASPTSIVLPASLDTSFTTPFDIPDDWDGKTDGFCFCRDSRGYRINDFAWSEGFPTSIPFILAISDTTTNPPLSFGRIWPVSMADRWTVVRVPEPSIGMLAMLPIAIGFVWRWRR